MAAVVNIIHVVGYQHDSMIVMYFTCDGIKDFSVLVTVFKILLITQLTDDLWMRGNDIDNIFLDNSDFTNGRVSFSRRLFVASAALTMKSEP